jgi:hypothetical protein
MNQITKPSFIQPLLLSIAVAKAVKTLEISVRVGGLCTPRSG